MANNSEQLFRLACFVQMVTFDSMWNNIIKYTKEIAWLASKTYSKIETLNLYWRFIYHLIWMNQVSRPYCDCRCMMTTKARIIVLVTYTIVININRLLLLNILVCVCWMWIVCIKQIKSIFICQRLQIIRSRNEPLIMIVLNASK